MITIKDEREIDLMRHAGHVVGLVHRNSLNGLNRV